MKVNGEERSLPQDGTVLGLLRELGHDPQRVAVEKNGSIVPRAAFAEEKLTDADHLRGRVLRGRRLIRPKAETPIFAHETGDKT